MLSYKRIEVQGTERDDATKTANIAFYENYRTRTIVLDFSFR